MIYGIGVDLVKIKRMEDIISRWGDRFINRVFTPKEVDVCKGRVFPASAFSLRFAAKEAFSKAIGMGMTGGMNWRDIEVFHKSGGQPCLRLYGRPSEFCRGKKIKVLHLSLSDDSEYGVAMVVLEQ